MRMLDTKSGHVEDVYGAALDAPHEVREHLASCAVCETLVLSARRFLGQVKTAAAATPVPDAPETLDILAKVRSRRAARRRHRVLAAAASILLVAGGTVGVVHDAHARATRRLDVADDALLRSLDDYDHAPNVGGLGTLVEGGLTEDTQG
ncbi:MAG: hypothetical protein U0166_00195 [Acidobacteriota bacterium]